MGNLNSSHNSKYMDYETLQVQLYHITGAKSNLILKSVIELYINPQQ